MKMKNYFILNIITSTIGLIYFQIKKRKIEYVIRALTVQVLSFEDIDNQSENGIAFGSAFLL